MKTKTKLLLIIFVILLVFAVIRSAKAQETHSIYLPAVDNARAITIEENDVAGGNCWQNSNRCSWVVTQTKFDEMVTGDTVIDFLGTAYARQRVCTVYSNDEFEDLIWAADGDGVWISRHAAPLEGEQKVIFYGRPR